MKNVTVSIRNWPSISLDTHYGGEWMEIKIPIGKMQEWITSLQEGLDAAWKRGVEGK